MPKRYVQDNHGVIFQDSKGDFNRPRKKSKVWKEECLTHESQDSTLWLL